MTTRNIFCDEPRDVFSTPRRRCCCRTGAPVKRKITVLEWACSGHSQVQWQCARGYLSSFPAILIGRQGHVPRAAVLQIKPTEMPKNPFCMSWTPWSRFKIVCCLYQPGYRVVVPFGQQKNQMSGQMGHLSLKSLINKKIVLRYNIFQIIALRI